MGRASVTALQHPPTETRPPGEKSRKTDKVLVVADDYDAVGLHRWCTASEGLTVKRKLPTHSARCRHESCIASLTWPREFQLQPLQSFVMP